MTITRNDAPRSAELAGGLTTVEARNRLARDGPNAMPEIAPEWWRTVLGKFWAPVPCMLEAAIVLQLVVHEYAPAAVIGGLVILNAALSLFQETRAQATLDALKARLALNAAVRRDGSWQMIAARDLVPGDVVKISLGTVVPADIRILDGDVLLDQSVVTGESLPIEAAAGVATYAGALVRRGEALAEVTATGPRTTYGQTAELVRNARVESSQQRAVFRVVRNLAIFNGSLVAFQLLYSLALHMPVGDIVALVLVATLASVPVALPAAFTLATAIGARALGRQGVLPTRLSAIDEAATMTVLCLDKTGTITQNELNVVDVLPLNGYDRARVIVLGALASAEGTLDPVDTAVIAAARGTTAGNLPSVVHFVPFDPARKLSEAIVTTVDGETEHVVKGAYPAVAALADPSTAAADAADALERRGFRVLAVARGNPPAMQLAGLIALSDRPRPESAALLAELVAMGVRPVMLTGDTPATAATIAHEVRLEGAVCTREAIPDRVRPEAYGVFAGVLPEDKYRIVKAFQADGRVVGMCGDGANDAPALRQAHIGIAVSTATDVAKSAAGIVLTEPGLGGIVAAVRVGRVTFQRILTFALRSIVGKIKQVLFLTSGLLLTGHAILTPVLMAILMVSGDFLALSATTDNVRPSARPNDWKIDRLTVAGIILGGVDLVFGTGVLALGKFTLGMSVASLQTLAAVTSVFSSQALFYVARERRHLWSSRPSAWFIASSVIDAAIVTTLALRGILMVPLPLVTVALVGAGAVALAFTLDAVKLATFGRLGLAER